VAGINGNPGEAFDTWLARAEKRALLNESLEDLNARLLQSASSSAGAG
jgi:hypothetical protein